MGRRFEKFHLRATTMGALRRMGIFEPTPIQAEALPPLLGGRDVIAEAPTGSGKTLAYVIPAAETIDTGESAVQVLILVPTRELANQVGGVAEALVGPRRARSAVLAGGREVEDQLAQLRQRVHLAVGTPGRVLDLLDRHVLRLDRLRLLVLDEADRMLDLGFGDDVVTIAGRANGERQTALFSATIGDPVLLAAKACLRDPVRITIDAPAPDEGPIDHVAYEAPQKIEALDDLLWHNAEGHVIVFLRTRHAVTRMLRRLEPLGFPAVGLRGRLAQDDRDVAMEAFRSGRAKVLVATNLAARGIDVVEVDLVVNFDLPESADLLVHRIGRTGRMGRAGRAVTLVGPGEREAWERLGAPVPLHAWPGAPAALGVPPRPRPVGPHKGGLVAPCADCGAEAHVAFDPGPGRPIYCAACFAKRKRL